jgi:hypothetical protein
MVFVLRLGADGNRGMSSDQMHDLVRTGDIQNCFIHRVRSGNEKSEQAKCNRYHYQHSIIIILQVKRRLIVFSGTLAALMADVDSAAAVSHAIVQGCFLKRNRTVF